VDALLPNLLFWALAAVIVISAMITAFARTVIYAGFALLFTFMGVVGLYLYLHADFLGITQLVIYVGGILVLLLFGVMFTQGAGLIRQPGRGAIQLPSALIASAIGLYVLLHVILYAPWPVRAAQRAAEPTTRTIGELLLTKYLLPFEVASMLLLIALVGGVVLARGETKEPGTET